MAIVRCNKHPVHYIQARNYYVRRVEPIGYPETAALCGKRDCVNPGYIWLTLEEHDQYIKGKRCFPLDTALVTIAVSDNIKFLPDQYVDPVLNELKRQTRARTR